MLEEGQPDQRVAERREGYCAMHETHSKDISRQGGMWTFLMIFIVAMLGFAGYVGKSAYSLDNSVTAFTAITNERMKMYDETFLDMKSMLALQSEMLQDIDGRVRNLEYWIDNRSQTKQSPSGDN